MKLNILFWNIRDKIILNERDNKLFDIVDNTEESFYCVLNHEKIKAVFTECSSNEFINNHLKGLYNRHECTVIVLKEINHDNISVVREASKFKNIIIISGKCDSGKKEEFKNLIYVPQLYYEESAIDVYTFLYTIRNIYDEVLGDNSLKTTSIILGCEKEEGILGSIPLYILKHFNYVSECNEFILNIHGLKELGTGQLIYIEDPLKEYMNDNSKLTIEQEYDCSGDNKIYFSLIAR
ncbi:MAG: hypothetical protein Q4F66_14285 [Clostridium sp.]|nr:hypothetical protein [Clostridium sp.]